MSITRTIKKNKGILKRPRDMYGYCRKCHEVMKYKPGYGHICEICGKVKPFRVADETIPEARDKKGHGGRS